MTEVLPFLGTAYILKAIRFTTGKYKKAIHFIMYNWEVWESIGKK